MNLPLAHHLHNHFLVSNITITTFYLYRFSDNNSQLNKISIFSNIVYRLTSIKDESNNSNFKGFDIAKDGNIFITSYTKFAQIYDNIYLYKINKDLESDCFYPSLFFINETRKYDLSINNWDSFNNTQILLTNATYNAVVHNATSKTLCESSNCIKKNIIQEECNETFITEFSSNKLSEFMDAANTKDGGFIAVGSSSSNGLIAKIKHNGDIGSAKLVDSLLYGTIYNFIVPSANNSYIISGTSDLSYNHRGSKHARLLRINESTEIINKLSIVGVQIDGIAPTKDGGVIVIFNRNIGSSPVYNYAVKFDIQFNVVWKKELKNLDGKVNKITFENNELYIGYESLRLMGMVYCGTIRLNPENGNVIWSRQFNFGYDMYDNGAVNNNLFSDDNYVYCFLLRHNKLHLYNPSFSTLMLKLSKADGSLVDSKEIITYNNTLPQVARNDLFRGNVTKAYPSGFLLSYSAKLPTGDTALMVKKLNQNGEFEWIKYYTLKSITVNNIRQVGKGYVISGSWNRENDKIRYPLYKNMTLIKIDSLGNISNNNIANCQTITGIASYGNYTPDQSNNSIESDELYMDLEFSNIKLVELDIPLKVNQYCHKKSTCNEIEVVDTESICSMNQEAIFYLDKNCAAAKWKYDTAYFEKIVESHDTLRLKPLKSGIGKVEVLATNACETISKEFQVTILTNANDLDLGPDKILCNELDKTVLNAGSFYKDVIWSTGETTPEITVSKPDKYTVTVSDFCGNTATKEISILKNLNTLKIIGEKEKCFNDTINLKLETNNYQNIIWSPDNKYIKVDNSEIRTYTDKSIKYIVSATDQNNCELKDSIMIEVKAIIPLNIGNDTTICPNESIILKVNNNSFMSYEWNTGETTSQINAKEPMSYLAHATHTNGCIYSDTLKLTNFQFIIAPNLGNDTSICSNSSLELGPGIFKAYQWNSSDYSNSKYTIKNAGKYWVDVVDFNGCKASDSIVVLSIIDAPSNFLKKQDSICNFETLDISSLKTFNTYNWSNGSISKTINISKPGLYYLNVKADNGCYAKDSINVTMATNCNNGIHVPNAFTPNNDGKNDLFKPLIFEKLLYYEFTIFNRWGQIVFHSLNTNIGWDGKHNGVNQESNTYIWQLNYQMENNSPSQKKGTVLLFR